MWHQALHLKSLPTGTKQKILIENKNILLSNINSEVFATQNICSHAQVELSNGGLEGDAIICPGHGAMFSVRDGSVRSLPATKPLKTYSTKIEDGIIFVYFENC